MLRAFRSLVKSRGWELLVEVANAQIKSRENAIITAPLDTLQSMLELKTNHGERQGIKLFVELPNIMIENYEEDLEDAIASENADRE